MARPKKCRNVGRAPCHTFFKPQGVPLEGLTGVNLSVEGLEAIRLADAEQMDHDHAAALMSISRPTFSRVLGEARRIVARALSNGWAININGGDYRIVDTEASSDPAHAAESGRRESRKTT
jgi:uncharacterized protein